MQCYRTIRHRNGCQNESKLAYRIRIMQRLLTITKPPSSHALRIQHYQTTLPKDTSIDRLLCSNHSSIVSKAHRAQMHAVQHIAHAQMLVEQSVLVLTWCKINNQGSADLCRHWQSSRRPNALVAALTYTAALLPYCPTL